MNNVVKSCEGGKMNLCSMYVIMLLLSMLFFACPLFSLAGECMDSKTFEEIELNSRETIGRLRENITIDGNIEDWNGLAFDAIGVNGSREKSISSLLYSGWDDLGLCFSAEIFDDKIYSPSEDPECYREQDCFELFLDVRGLDRAGRHPDSRGNRFDLDYFVVVDSLGNQTIIDSLSPQVKYRKGKWVERTNVNCVGGSFQQFSFENKEPITDEILEDRVFSVEIQFEGTSIRVGTVFSENSAMCKAFIDGEFVSTVDSFDYVWPRDSKVSFDSGRLPDGEHVLRLEYVPPVSDGIVHALVTPDQGNGVLYLGRKEVVVNRSEIISRRTDDGWIVEGRIAWEDLGGKAPSEGESIRYGYKIYDRDEASSASTIGLKRQGSRTNVNWIRLHPERFPKIFLDNNIKEGNILVNAREVLFQGETWVEIEAIVKKHASNDAKLVLECPNGKVLTLEMIPSQSDRFLWVKKMFKVDELSDGAECIYIPVTFRYGELFEKKRIVVYQTIRKIVDYVNQELPQDRIDQLPSSVRGIVYLLKQSALELAGFYENKRNRSIDHYHHLNLYSDDYELFKHIEEVVNEAKVALLKCDYTSNMHVQAWQSKIDGSWQFFTVEFPDDYEKKELVRVRIEFHINNKKRLWPTYRVIKKIHSGELRSDYVTHSESDLLIRLSSRGNSASRLGDEEFEYILQWLSDNFNSICKEIYVTGISAGSTDALLFATRYADRVSAIDLRSPVVEVFVGEKEGSFYDNVSVYESLVNDIKDKVENTWDVPIRINVGGDDRVGMYAGKLLHVRHQLGGGEVASEYNVIKNEGHSIRRENVPSLDVSIWRNSGALGGFSIYQTNLRYGARNGVSAEGKEFEWRPYRIRSFLENGKTRIYSTENLNFISLEKKEVFRGGVDQVKVDNVLFRVNEFYDKGLTYFCRDKDGWFVSDYGESLLRKRPLLQGPIGDLEKEGFVIVYGTKDPDAEPILRNRAKRIVEHRVGSDAGQWASGNIVVLSDREVTDLDIKNKNLWLIGNERENSIVELVFKRNGCRVEEDRIVLPGREWLGKSLFVEYVTINPIYGKSYVYIESAQSLEAYNSEVLLNRKFDFSITNYDSILNESIARGVFDSNWRLDSIGAIVWE